jgi:hypothetical protein
MGRPARKRPRIGRIILAVIAIAAVGEPLYMYRSLMHERAHRNAAREQPLESSPVAPGTGG